MAGRKRASCGLELCSPADLDASTKACTMAGFDFVTVPIVHPRYEREFEPEKVASLRDAPLTRPDLILSGSDWCTLIVGRLSPTINVDSRVPAIRKYGQHRLHQELKYASHLGLPAIQVKLTGTEHTNLARIISNNMLKGASFQVWVQVPFIAADSSVFESSPATTTPTTTSTWQWWNRFRLMANSLSKINLCMDVGARLPSETELVRWLGEPIKTLLIPTSIFLTNKKGYPVLSRPYQVFLRRFVSLDIQLIVKGPCRHESVKFYQQYLDHIWQQEVETVDPLRMYARGYEDYLQVPLQPLMDNLESSTYEVFEKDPVKYAEYQNAMMAAITDMVPPEEKDTRVLTVMVVGAGRGPLVRAALTAAKTAERKIRVFAVEKNPNAVVTLQQQKIEIWGDQVRVISSDMREWNPPEEDYADILVSELLGSFGDNELSPECLDGAQKFLKPTGISIPSSYTSYIGPIQSTKLYNEFRNSKDENKPPMAPFETPYVVHLQNRCELAPPQPLFTFVHPNLDPVIDNSRYEVLNFSIEQDSVLHGLGGYFECILYKEIMLSILPATHSPGMFSWFPILFPLKEPLQLKQGDLLTLHFWRLVSKKSVWYEWSISSPVTTPIHNPNGRSSEIGL